MKFAPCCEFFSIPSRYEYSNEELYDMHLSRQDRLRIQEDRHYTLQAMEQGVYPDDDLEYFRGLEYGLDIFNRDKQRRIRTARSAILDTQAHLTAAGESIDPLYIELYYRKITYASTLTAHRAGCYDASQSSRNSNSD